MQGVSISINTLVILIVAVLVLLAIASFFMGVFLPESHTISDIDAWNRGCGLWKLSGCSLEERDGERCLPSITIAGYDPNGDGKFDDLAVACVRVFGASTSGMFIDGGGGGTIQLRCRPEVVELCTEKCCGTSPQTE